MRDDWVPNTPEEFAVYLKELHAQREANKVVEKALMKERTSPTQKERELIFSKTGGRCHVCGGEVDGRWEADHVMAHSGGGSQEVDNYLPAHSVCNNYRWDYLPEEFQEILRLGVWLRTQIEHENRVGRIVAEQFIKHEQTRIKRRKK